MARILVGCEFSGIVRDAFIRAGHDAWSCDLLSAKGPHLQCDVRDVLGDGWDLLIAHPPCTCLAVSGARWWRHPQELQQAIDLVKTILSAPVQKIALENPVGRISTLIRKPDQIIQPWQFGHGETKKTCLWLKNLPLLRATCIVRGRESRIHHMPPSKDRGRERSITYPGIALAMATQWGSLL